MLHSPLLYLFPPPLTWTPLFPFFLKKKFRIHQLYAAGREDLKRGLGQGLFGPDFYISDVEECIFELFEERSRGRSGGQTGGGGEDENAVLTEAEKQVR